MQAVSRPVLATTALPTATAEEYPQSVPLQAGCAGSSPEPLAAWLDELRFCHSIPSS